MEYEQCITRRSGFKQLFGQFLLVVEVAVQGPLADLRFGGDVLHAHLVEALGPEQQGRRVEHLVGLVRRLGSHPKVSLEMPVRLFWN